MIRGAVCGRPARTDLWGAGRGNPPGLPDNPYGEPAAGDFRPGPEDMLDSIVAAFTVREFWEGRGCEVGGGDGLGTIVLPRPAPDEPKRVHAWPA